MRRITRHPSTGLACLLSWMILAAPAGSQAMPLSTQPEGPPTFLAPALVLDAGAGIIAKGDFNGDGIVDAGVASVQRVYGADGFPEYGIFLRTARGHGDGSFDPVQTVSSMQGLPSALLAADINGGGHLDLVVLGEAGLSQQGYAWVFLGDGLGAFRPGAILETSLFSAAVAAGDLNGDGVADLVVASYWPGQVDVFLGTGNGSFAPRVEYPTAPHPTDLALVDLNSDGALDLAVSCYTNQLSVLYGDGHGGFRDRIDAPAGFEPLALAAGDLNEDGRPDLVVANGGAECTPFGGVTRDSTLTIYYTDAGGHPGTRADVQVGYFPSSVAISDLDGDGHLDLSVVNSFGGMIVCFDGASSPADAMGGPRAAAMARLAGGAATGRAVVDPSKASLRVLLGHGDGTFTERSRFRTGPATAQVIVADTNGDGVPDLLVTDGSAGSISTLLGNGDGTFGHDLAFATGSEPVAVAGADLNRDGIADILTVNRSSSSISIYLSGPGGTFERLADLSTGHYPTAIATGEFNRDGNLDVAVAYFGLGDSSFTTPGAGGVSVFLGSRDGHLSFLASYSLGGRCNKIVSADFNGDGQADLAVSSAGPAWVTVLLSDGSGGFRIGPTYPLSYISGGLCTADFNGDGIPDLATTTNSYDNALRVLLGEGNGSFRAVPQSGPFGLVQNLVSRDFNGDGHADLIATFFGICSFLPGHGDGTFAWQQPFIAAHGSTDIATGDFNGDGRFDLAISGAVQGAVAVLRGPGDGTFGDRRDYGMGGLASGVASADVTGDGAPDLLLADAQANEVHVFVNTQPATLPARAFLTGSARTIPLGAGPPKLCVQIEPAPAAFQASDIDRSTIVMTSPGTGSVSSISPTPAKQALVSDSNRNGIGELSACFVREDLARLFDSIRGRRQVRPAIAGRLWDGRSFRAVLELTVLSPGRSIRAQVSPNPLNPTGRLAFTVARAGAVSVRLYDVTGRLVRTVWSSRAVQPGAHEAVLDGRDESGRQLGSGIYFYRIDTAEGSLRGRFAILK